MPKVVEQQKLVVVEPAGHINASNAGDLKLHLSQVINSEVEAVLVDLSAVQSLDSAGLMALVSGLTLAQRQDKKFSLCCVSPAIRIIFELTQLDKVFEMFENRPAWEKTL